MAVFRVISFQPTGNLAYSSVTLSPELGHETFFLHLSLLAVVQR